MSPIPEFSLAKARRIADAASRNSVLGGTVRLLGALRASRAEQMDFWARKPGYRCATRPHCDRRNAGITISHPSILPPMRRGVRLPTHFSAPVGIFLSIRVNTGFCAIFIILRKPGLSTQTPMILLFYAFILIFFYFATLISAAKSFGVIAILKRRAG